MLETARRSPYSVSFDEFETLMDQCGLGFAPSIRQQSPVVLASRLPLADAAEGGMAKAYQVAQKLTQNYENRLPL